MYSSVNQFYVNVPQVYPLGDCYPEWLCIDLSLCFLFNIYHFISSCPAHTIWPLNFPISISLTVIFPPKQLCLSFIYEKTLTLWLQQWHRVDHQWCSHKLFVIVVIVLPTNTSVAVHCPLDTKVVEWWLSKW